MSRRLTRLAEILGINAIPVVGVLAGDWSPSTALAVYWAENLIASVLVAARLALHARWRDPASVPQVRPDSSFAPRRALAFLGTAIPFSLAHGVMLALVSAGVLHTRPDLDQLRQAAIALAVLQVLAFGVDLWTLAEWPVSRVNERADYILGRVMLVHLSILVGMFVAGWLDRPGAFFGFFVGCKVLSDLTALLPRIDGGTPGAPPRWLSRIMRRFPRQNGETFDEYLAAHQRAGGARGTTDAPSDVGGQAPEAALRFRR